MAKKKGTSVVTFAILLLLILGLAGFGVTNFGGSVRSVATVGSAEVTTNDYARAIDAQMRAFQQQTGQQMDFQQARAFGLDRIALAQLIGNAALEDEVASIGISAGDETVGRRIQGSEEFRNASGEFDRQIYELMLERSRTNADDFETRVRSDIAEGLLQSAVAAGVRTPDIFTDTLFNYARETRDVTWARLTSDDLETQIAEPSEADLEVYHTENPEDFTRPETKVITYALLTPEMLASQIEVSEDQLRTLYDARIDEFVQPERRLVERLVFPDEAQAEAARDQIDAGETSFDVLVALRGLDLADVDLGDVTRDELGPAADAIFALEEPGVAGPLPSDFGPALFRMNGILAAQETTFEDARADLTTEAALDRARRIILESVPQIQDLLAGGADMSVLAERTDMEAGTIEWNAQVFEGVAAYTAFRSAAAAAQKGGFAEVIDLDDGGIVSLSVDDVRAPELRPLDQVRDDVTSAWIEARTSEALVEQGEALAEQIRNGREMAALGLRLETNRGLERAAFIEGTPPDFTTALFEMEPNELRVLSADGDAWLLRLDAIAAPDASTPAAEALRNDFASRTAIDFSSGITAAFTQALVNNADVELNQAALNAVGAQRP
ncbi:MAG: peptidylprolyl isomerase [Silicimonas sp.]|nr:peptidylprolyl isomerase [Silicimonas sp.]